MRNRYFILIVTISLLLLSSCSRQETAANKSIEQLHIEKGVPVEVKVVADEYFGKNLRYNGKLSGINQATEQSLVGGNVEKIYFSEGDYVHKDDLVLSFPEDLTGMNYQAVKANYTLLAATYDRLRQLYEEGGIAKQEVDNTETGYLAARSQLKTIEQMLQVKAPISGYLTAIYVQETDHVESGDLLFTVSELDRLKTEIAVTEKEINLFSKGSKAVAYWENIEYQGEVTSVGYAMNERSGVFEVELQFANPQKIMKFNINAEIEVEVYHNPAALVVEKKHLLRDSGGDYVFVAKGDNAEKRYVTLGESSGIRFEIISGLAAGEELIVESKDLLADGSLIRR
ncbi:MAG: efflux RND transporter periplasmic adaptor subunit [Candidatus Cloacimonetes bacterium]|nr:efflux RND transporter periplasmic adaptor subunit [Candidatus Cloacimonadota bacterium]